MNYTALFFEWLKNPLIKAGAVFFCSLLIALIVHLVLKYLYSRWAVKTRFSVDDIILAYIRPPLVLSIVAAGLWYVIALNQSASAVMKTLFHNGTETVVIIFWTFYLLALTNKLISALAANAKPDSFIQQRTQPIIQMVIKTIIVFFAFYFVFEAWDRDMSAWLASAGVIGIAVGFAAKDTLANLFAGIFIIADAPFKIGDYIHIDNSIRGEVTHIGLRSIRVLTRDDVEVIVPNSLIGNSTVINESGGPYEKFRVKVEVSAAYGSDIDQVREILMKVADQEPMVAEYPKHRVRFRSFGDSGLIFHLLVWINKPALKGQAVDKLNEAIYKAFKKNGIEIPYPKRDVYMYQKAE